MWLVTTKLEGTAWAPCQGVILRPVSASHGDLLETWNPRLWPQPTESESALSQDPWVPRDRLSMSRAAWELSSE